MLGKRTLYRKPIWKAQITGACVTQISVVANNFSPLADRNIHFTEPYCDRMTQLDSGCEISRDLCVLAQAMAIVLAAKAVR